VKAGILTGGHGGYSRNQLSCRQKLLMSDDVDQENHVSLRTAITAQLTAWRSGVCQMQLRRS